MELGLSSGFSCENVAIKERNNRFIKFVEMKKIFVFLACTLMNLVSFSSCEINEDTEYSVINETGHEVIVHEYNYNGDEVKRHEVIWDDTFRADPAARKVLVSYSLVGVYTTYEFWNDHVYQLQRNKRINITLTDRGWQNDKPKIK